MSYPMQGYPGTQSGPSDIQGFLRWLQSVGIDPNVALSGPPTNYLQQPTATPNPQGVINWLQQMGIDARQAYGVRP